MRPLALLSIVFVVLPAAAGTEARCLELGLACACSEPMEATVYTSKPGVDWAWNPNDTTSADKECNTSGQAGAFVEVNGFDSHYAVVSSGAAMAALPARHTNARVLRLLDGVGGMFAGVKFNHGEPHARRGFRYYKYYSPDYSFTDDVPLCNSAKWGQLGNNGAGTAGPLLTEQTWSFYDVEASTGFNESGKGCCFGPGPGNSAAPPSKREMKGKWWRLEFYIDNTNASGAPTTFQAYVKNVTDDAPEIRVLDSSVAQDFPSGENWTSPLATQLHPTRDLTDMSINMFRSNNGQACTGYAAFAYFMAAAWPVSAGQRIGAAREIEGDASAGETDAGATAPVDAGVAPEPVVDAGTQPGDHTPFPEPAPPDVVDGCGCGSSPGVACAALVALGALRRRRARIERAAG